MFQNLKSKTRPVHCQDRLTHTTGGHVLLHHYSVIKLSSTAASVHPSLTTVLKPILVNSNAASGPEPIEGFFSSFQSNLIGD